MIEHHTHFPPIPKNAIFVFGSNLAGRHGKGAALEAKNLYGAVYGVGIGLRGRSYAIPTKDEHLNTLPLERIQSYITHFLNFARANPQLRFAVTPIGCGLAGYKPHQIAPMFAAASNNVTLPQGWDRYQKLENPRLQTPHSEHEPE